MSRLPETKWEFWVVDKRTGKTDSVHDLPRYAQLARDARNQHEVKEGREPVFEVVPYSFTRT